MKKNILIVGADSSLAQQFIKAISGTSDVQLTLTTRKLNSAHYYLDLATPIIGELSKQEFDVAIVFASMTNMADCENNQTKAFKVNCTSVHELIKEVPAKQWVLFSTNMVFDGQTPNVSSDARYSPFNAYGASKAEMERVALGSRKNIAILRLTKVIGEDFELLKKSLQKLASGESVGLYEDMYLAPISLTQVIQYLIELIHNFKSGVHQLSGQSDVSYYQLGLFLSKELKINSKMLFAVSKKIESPKHTTLKVDKTEVNLGFCAPSLSIAMQDFINKFVNDKGERDRRKLL